MALPACCGAGGHSGALSLPQILRNCLSCSFYHTENRLCSKTGRSQSHGCGCRRRFANIPNDVDLWKHSWSSKTPLTLKKYTRDWLCLFSATPSKIGFPLFWPSKNLLDIPLCFSAPRGTAECAHMLFWLFLEISILASLASKNLSKSSKTPMMGWVRDWWQETTPTHRMSPLTSRS